MRLRLALAVAAAALIAAPAQLPAAPAKEGAAAKDWTRTVVATPEGGFRMGNPNAKVKVIEYGSLTCPHCAHFAVSGYGPLKTEVRSGKVSFEYRSFVLNGIDLAATLVARCGGPSKFFPVAEKMFATQKQWMGKISDLPQAEKDKVMALAPEQRLGRVAELGGLVQLAAQHGVAPQKTKQCLADEAEHERLQQMYEATTAQGVNGTPTFVVNGTRIHAHEWAEVEPLIRKAAG